MSHGVIVSESVFCVEPFSSNFQSIFFVVMKARSITQLEKVELMGSVDRLRISVGVVMHAAVEL